MGICWLIAGLLLPYGIYVLPPPAAVLLLLCAILTLPLLRSSTGPLVLLAACAWTCWHIDQQRNTWQQFALPGTRIIEGRIASLPVVRGEYLEFQLVVQDHDPELGGMRLLVRWYRNWPTISAGQQWRLQLSLKPARSRVNFAGHGREPWFFAWRIAALATVGKGPNQLIGNSARFDLLALREQRSNQLSIVLDGHPAYATIATLAVADRRHLAQSEWQRFNSTGTAHLLAISGLHIGIAAAMGWWVGRLLVWLVPALFSLRFSGLICWTFSIITALAYASMSGFPPSTKRALIMLACAALASLCGHVRRPWFILAAALLVVLLFDPLAPLTAGLWLSFGAVAALVWAFSGHLQGRSWLRPLVRAQLAMLLLSMPLGMMLFQRATPGALIANLLAIPWASMLVVPFTVIGAMLLPLWPEPAAFLLLLSAENMQLLATLLDKMQGFALFELRSTHMPGLTLAATAILGGAILLMPRGLIRRAIAVVLIIPLLVRPGLGQHDTRVELLDSGQGFAATLRSGQQLLVYDSGPGDGLSWSLVSSVLTPAIESVGGGPDNIIISHGDLDHAGGMHELLQRYPDATFSGSLPLAPPKINPCIAGQQWMTGQATVTVLHPRTGLPYLGNDSSCVISVDISGTRVMFAGDIGQSIEQRLVLEGVGRHEILFAAHHGSNSSSTPVFLDTVQPAYALVSTASNNRYGFPHPKVNERFAGIGAQLLSTSACGSIRFDIDEQGSLSFSSARRARTAPWRWPAAPYCP